MGCFELHDPLWKLEEKLSNFLFKQHLRISAVSAQERHLCVLVLKLISCSSESAHKLLRPVVWELMPSSRCNEPPALLFYN